MESILSLMKDFLPLSKVYQSYSDYDVYELFDQNTDEQIGMYTVNEEGELSSFSLEANVETGKATKNELVIIAKRFIETFHPNKKDKYDLSAIIDLDQAYMISFEKREEKYGLFLHSEGFTVTVSTSGQVQQFFYAKEDYQIVYPETIIPEEKALETFMEHLNFDLNFTKFDKEVYKNGDNQIHLAYNVNEQAFDIPADWREPAVIKQEVERELISLQEGPSEDPNHVMRLTNDELSNNLSEMNNNPVISLQEAKEIYKNLLKMELIFVREYDENYRAVYTLSYGPSFPETLGHVRAIDAITGKAMYVDMGDGTFYK